MGSRYNLLKNTQPITSGTGGIQQGSRYNVNRAKNQGGLAGSVGYVGASLAAGIGGVFEGIGDVLSAAANIGDREYARQLFAENKTGNWLAGIERDVNPNGLTKFAGDVASGIGQSSVFLLDAAVPFLGTGLFFSGITGSGIGNAVQQTGELGLKEVGYGAASGALEAVTEKVLGAGGQVVGNLASAATQGAAKRAITKAAAKSGARNILINVAKAAGGEFAEEFSEEFADVWLKKMFRIDPNAKVSGQTLLDALYAGAAGAVSGGLMAAPAAVANYKGSAARGRMITEQGRAESLIKLAEQTSNIAELSGKAFSLNKQAVNEKRKADTERTAGDKLYTAFMDAKNGKENRATVQFGKAIKDDLDVWNSLTEEQKAGEAGQALLGQIEGNMTFHWINAAIDTNADALAMLDDADLEEAAAEIKQLTGREYTVQEIREDKDMVLRQVAAFELINEMKDQIAEMQKPDTGTAQGTEAAAGAGASADTQGAAAADQTGAQTAENAQGSPVSGFEETQANTSANAEQGKAAGLAVNPQGKRVSTETGRQVRVKNVKAENGKLVFETEGNELYKSESLTSDKVQWESQVMADAVREAEALKMQPLEAQYMIKGIEKGTQLSGADYALAFHGEFLRGKYGQKQSVSTLLSQDAKDNAYLLGDDYGKREALKRSQAISAKTTAEQAQKLRQTVAAMPQAERVKLPDGMKFTDIRGEGRKAVVKAAGVLSQALGVKFEFYQSYQQSNGGPRMMRLSDGSEMNAPYGYWDADNNTIHLDLNSEKNADGAAIFTMGHELGHFIMKSDPAGFREMGEVLFSNMETDADQMIREKMESLERLGRFGTGWSFDKKYAYAYEEVVCDCMSPLLQDGRVIEQLAYENMNLFQKVWEHIKSVIRNIRDALKGASMIYEDGRRVKEQITDLKKIEDLYAAVLEEAAQNNGSRLYAKIFGVDSKTSEQLIKDGFNVTKVGAVVDQRIANVINDNAYQPPQSALDEAIKQSPRTFNLWAGQHEDGETQQERDQNAERVRLLRIMTDRMTASDAVKSKIPDGEFDKVGMGPIRSNDEYIWTFDMDTSCPRTYVFMNIRNRIQRRLVRPLTYEESVNLLEMMRARGLSIPCTYCYVENKRIQLADSYNKWFKHRNDVMNAETDADALKLMYGYDAKKNSITEAGKPVFEKWRKDRSYKPTVSEVWTASETSRNSVYNYLDGLQEKDAGTSKGKTTEELLQDVCARYGITYHKNDIQKTGTERQLLDMVEQWRYDVNGLFGHEYKIENDTEVDIVDARALQLNYEALAYAKSASSAKTTLEYVPYDGQLSKVSKEDREFILSMGGFRIHSSNDFRIDYVHDYLMFWADMAKGKWTSHCYTKSPDFVKIFGRTGVKINMSIAAYGDTTGTIRMNAEEGMNWDEAKKLKKAYPNAGVMFMATNEAQLSWALNQDWIDMIIPFHSSSLRKEVWSDIRLWNDFQAAQNEKPYTKQDKVKMLKQVGITFPKETRLDENGNLILDKKSGKPKKFDASAETVDKAFQEYFKPKKAIGEDGTAVTPHFLPGQSKKKGAVIPAHKNDLETYFDLCRQYAVHPRFDGIKVDDGHGKPINVVDHPNYFRLIKETSRLDSPQETIKFNFNEEDKFLGMTPFEYIMQSLEYSEKQGARPWDNWGMGEFGDVAEDFVRDYIDRPIGYLTLKDRKYVLERTDAEAGMNDILPFDLPQFRTTTVEDIEALEGEGYTGSVWKADVDEKKAGGKKVRVVREISENLKMSDREYMDAVDSGDMDTAQSMVKEAAKKAGYKYEGYHGSTTATFTKFKEGLIYHAANKKTADFYTNGKEWGKEIISGPSIQDRNGKHDIEKRSLTEMNRWLKENGQPQYKKAKQEEADRFIIDRANRWVYQEYLDDMVQKDIEKMNAYDASNDSEPIKNYVEKWRKAAEVYNKRKNGGKLTIEDAEAVAALVDAREEAAEWALEDDHDTFQKYFGYRDGLLANPRFASSDMSNLVKRRESGDFYFKGSEKEYLYQMEEIRKQVKENKKYDYRITRSGVLHDFIRMDDPMTIDAKGTIWEGIYLDDDFIGTRNSHRYTTDEIAAKVKELGHDGAIIKNVFDSALSDYFTTDEYIVFDSSQVKSAEPVTLDNDGEFIPLSERFNSGEKDIRYSDRKSLTTRELLADVTEEEVSLKRHKEFIGRYREVVNDLRDVDADLYRLKQKKARGQKLTADEVANERALNDMRLTLDSRLNQLEGMNQAREIIENVRVNTQKAVSGAQARVERAQREVDEYKEAVKERYEKYREKRNAREQKNMDAMRERLEKERNRNEEWRDTYEAGEVKRKTLNSINRLNRMLTHPTRDKNIPAVLQPDVVNALEAISTDVTQAEARMTALDEKIAAEMAKDAPDMEQIRIWEKARANIEEIGKTYDKQMAAIQLVYEKIKDSKNSEMRNAYDPGLEAAVNDIANRIRGRSLNQLTLDELKDVRRVVGMVEHLIATYNETMATEKKQRISDLGEKTTAEIRQVGGEHKTILSALHEILKFGWSQLKPAYAVKVIGSDTLQELYNNLVRGEDIWAIDKNEAKKFADSVKEKYGFKTWDLDKTVTVDTQSGKVDLNLKQIMSLYAYSKRPQAVEHLTTGGFVLDNELKTTQKWKGIPLEYDVNIQTPYMITLDDFRAIQRNLTDEQRAFVEDMMKYLSTTLAAKGNAVSRKLYGIDLFNEETYFPIRSARQFLVEENRAKGDPQIKNKGMTKQVTPGAGNPIVLSDFTAVWAKHVDEMALYHGLVLPMEDLNRVLNWSSPTGEGVKVAMDNAYGPEAKNYMVTLMQQLNGGLQRDRSVGLSNRMLSGFKRGATMASLSVVIQQPTSIIRSMSIIDPKYFKSGFIKSIRERQAVWDELKSWAPVALIKESGSFDVDVGASDEALYFGKEYDTIKDKAAALVKDADYRNDVLGKAPEIADQMAWCYMWEACKNKVEAETNLKRGSDEFMQKAADVFSEAVRMTQVYDSRLTRSEMMRSPDFGAKLITTFMAEPTTSFNMLAWSVLSAKRGDKEGLKAIGYVVASILLNSILVSAVYAMRDDDEDKTYGEKYMKSLIPNIIDNANPLNMLPVTRDIVSIFQGYDVERADMSLVSDVIKAFKGLQSSTKSPYRKIEDFAGSVANIFGIPAKNVLRDVRGMINTAASVGNVEKTGLGTKYAILSGFGKDVSKGQQMYDALMKGDEKHFERVAAQYASESAARTQLRLAMRANDERISLAAEARAAGNTETAMQIQNRIIEEGHFDQDDVIAAVNAEYNLIKKEEQKNEAR